MRNQIFIFGIVCIITSIFPTTILCAQEMKIVRIADGKIAGDKGSNDGINQNQYFTIYKFTSTGKRPIGRAQVFVVKNSVCGLNIIEQDTNYPISVGDLLEASIDTYTPPPVSETQTSTHQSTSSNKGTFGIRGGIGTDLTGGIVYGGALNYLFAPNVSPFEIAIVIFGGSFEETTEEFHTYTEKTDIFVYGLLGNYLINYMGQNKGVFFLFGTGFGMIDVTWEESSTGDVSLGTPLPGGGSKQSAEASSFALILNLGLGYKFNPKIDARFEIPMFIITSVPGNASSFAPTFTLTLGVRFN